MIPTAFATTSRGLHDQRLALDHAHKGARFTAYELMAAPLAVDVVNPLRDVIAEAPATLGLGGLSLRYTLFTIARSRYASEE